MVGRLRWLLTGFVVFLLVSCGSSGPSEGVRVTLSPTSATVAPGGTQSFTATVTGTADKSVTWSATGGSVDGSGNTVTYTAPTVAGSYTLTATSGADPGQAASAAITVGAGESSQGRIDITSDLSVMLTEAGDTAQLSAVVLRADGTVDANAKVVWTSSDPAAVTVDPNGLVTAKTNLGSATLTASYSTLSPVVATALVAELAPATRFIPSEAVLSRTESEAVLARNSLTESLQPGQILLSGSDAGVLLTVTSVQVQDTQVVVQGEPAALSEAFTALDVAVSGEPLTVTARLDESGGALTTVGDDGLTTQFSRDDFKCSQEGTAVVDLDALSPFLSFDYTLTPSIVIRKTAGTLAGLDQFTVQATAAVTLSAATGGISVTSSGGLTVKCEVVLETYETPSLQVSVLSFSFFAEPKLGLAVKATVDGSSLYLEGPRGSVGATAAAGIAYSRAGGWQTINDFDWTGDFDPFTASTDFAAAFSASAGPYAKLNAGLNVTLGRKVFGKTIGISLAKASFLEAEVYGRTTAELPRPLDPKLADYLGPSWKVGLGLRGALKAELSDGALGKLLKRVGVSVKIRFGSLELFDIDKTLWESPAPDDITARPEAVKILEPVTLTARALTGTDTTGDVQFWASKNDKSPLVPLGSAYFSNGLAQLKWQPQRGDEGRYVVYPRLRVDSLSSFKPYASDSTVTVCVGISPDECDVGEGIASGVYTIEGTHVGDPATMTMLSSFDLPNIKLGEPFNYKVETVFVKPVGGNYASNCSFLENVYSEFTVRGLQLPVLEEPPTFPFQSASSDPATFFDVEQKRSISDTFEMVYCSVGGGYKYIWTETIRVEATVTTADYPTDEYAAQIVPGCYHANVFDPGIGLSDVTSQGGTVAKLCISPP